MFLYDFILHDPCKRKKIIKVLKRYTDQMILAEYRYVGINVHIIRYDSM